MLNRLASSRLLPPILALAATLMLASTLPAAYRLTVADPGAQSLTSIPLNGFNPFEPWLSTGASLRAAPFFDGSTTAGVAHLAQSTFVPDPTSATILTVAPGHGHRFAASDVLRVSRTGELLRVMSVSGDSLTVSRAHFGSAPSALIDGDAITILSRHTSFVCWYLCEQPQDAPRATIWELDRRSASAATMNVAIGPGPSGWRIDAALAGTSPLAVDLPFDPRGRWLLLSLAHINQADSPADDLLLSVFDPATAQTLVAAAPFAAAFAPEWIPDTATIGDRFAIGAGTQRSALGICIPSLVADAVADGRVLPTGIATTDASALAHNKGLSGHVTFNDFESCVWATNYSAGAFGGTTNEARAGTTDGALHVFDRTRNFLNFRHQTDPGTSVYGGVVSVDPYLFGAPGLAPQRPAFDSTVGSIASPASATTMAALGGLHPSGLAGQRTRRFAAAITGGVAIDRLRIGIFGNSRAVYPQSYPLRLSSGEFAGRECRSNFVDMGVVGQAPIYNNGLLIGHIGPVPWCNWSDADRPSGGYGADCSAQLPLCVAHPDTSPVAVPSSVAMRSLVDSTLGSRFGIFSPTPTRVPSVGFPGLESQGTLDNYRGNHACVRLRPDHSARFMVRPELGMPASDPLRVTIYLLNHPSSSTVRARAVRAYGQGAPEVWSTPITTPGLGTASTPIPPQRKTITSVIQPRLSSPTTHTRFGSVTVSDLDGAFAAIEVGDMVQVYDPAGNSAPYNEAFAVREITRFANGNVRLTYDWLPRQFPAPGDSITFLKADQVLRKVTFEFPPCAADEWRGIEVIADASGDGVLLWGLGFENPVRNGIITTPIGRSGCGAWLQYNRWPVQAPIGGPSLLQRIFAELDLDVAVLTTADQGTPGGYHVQAYERIFDTFRFDSPDTELVTYATGPEYASEETLDKRDAFEKFSVLAAMQLAAANQSVPMTSFYFSETYRSSAFGRIESGVDTTESPTHPGTVLDISLLAQQILSLPAAPPEISPPGQIICRDGVAQFSVEASPEVELEYQWELENGAGGFAVLTDGAIVRSGTTIATISGASTSTLTISGAQQWDAGGWANPGRAVLRCTEIRPSGMLTSQPAELAVCPSDVDCSSGSDGDDVLLFFGWWDAGDPLADFNADGSVDGDDVIAFFGRWDAGC
jgi:hypothetical protein